MSAFGSDQRRPSGVGIPGRWGTDASNRKLFDTLRISRGDGDTFTHNCNREVFAILVSVFQGSVDIWNGLTGQVSDPPDYHFGQTNRPEWIPVTSGSGKFTIRASNDTGEPVLACIHFEGP